jgi:hypothetical protein
MGFLKQMKKSGEGFIFAAIFLNIILIYETGDFKWEQLLLVDLLIGSAMKAGNSKAK